MQAQVYEPLSFFLAKQKHIEKWILQEISAVFSLPFLVVEKLKSHNRFESLFDLAMSTMTRFLLIPARVL